MQRQNTRSQRIPKQLKDDSSTTRRQMTSQERVANRTQRSESPPIVVLDSEEIHKALAESGSKLLTRAKLLFYVISMDASQWDKRRLIKWVIWKTALIIMIIGLGINTVKTTWPIILEYTESPTSYIPKTSFNDSIALPSLIIYLPLSPDELDDYWKSSGNLSSSENSTHYQDLLTVYFDNKTKETLLAIEYQWPNFLLFVGYYYLSFFNDFESLTVNFNQTKGHIHFLNNSDNVLATALNILDERMIGLNITILEFQKKYGEVIKALFNLTFAKSNRVNSTMLNMEIDYCWIDFLQNNIVFYFKHFDQHPIKDGEAITVQATRSELPNPRSDDDNQGNMAIFLSARPYFELYDIQQKSKFNSLIPVIPLQVASTYRMLSYHNGIQQCYENKSIDSCIAECRMQYYRTKCDCFPTFRHTDLLFNRSECYLKHYKSCFNEENMFNIDDKAYNDLINCEKSCLDICERTKYFHPPQSGYYYQKDDEMFKKANYSIIELRIANFDYPIFEETPKWTFPSFICVLGGSLGLWLGINVLDYIIFATTGVQFFIRKCKRKAVNRTDTKLVIPIRRNAARRNAWEDSTPSVSKGNFTAMRSFFAFCIKIWTWRKLKKFAGIFLQIIIGMLSLMITLLALKEYFNKKTEQILNVKYNDSIALPNATICLPLEFGELDSSILLNDQETSYTFTLTDYLKIQNLEKEDFVPENYFWNSTVRNVVHAYLIEISNCEAGDYSKCDRILENNNDLVSAMNILEIIISRLNMSIDELRQRFGIEVADLYSLAVSIYDLENWVEGISISQTKYIGYNQICYEIPFNLNPLNIASCLEIAISEYTLPNPKSFRNNRNPITVDFENRIFIIESIRKYTFRAYFGQIFGLPVEISEYHSLREGNNGETRCSELTLDQCETVGHIKFIQNQCNCTPTSWPSLIDYTNSTTLDMCDRRQYSSCLNARDLRRNEEWISQCLRPCDRLSLVPRREWVMFSPNNWTAIIITANSMKVLIFDEKLTRSFEKLLEIVGGIIGFLLGYSLNDMLCFLFTLTASFFAFSLKRAILSWHKNSQIADIEVKPAPNTQIESVESNGENANDIHRFINVVHKLKKRAWKGRNLQWMLKHIFKLVLIIYFGYKTVKLCIPIILQYKEGKTMSVINFVTNKSLSLKPATVCITLIPEELDDHWVNNITEFEARIRIYFSQPNLTKKNFLGGMKWTNSLCFITYLYLIVLTQIETLNNQGRYDLTLPSDEDSSLPDFFEPWDKDLYSAVTLLERNLNLLNISVNELRQRLGLEVAAIYSLNAYQTSYCQGVFCQSDTKILIDDVTVVHSNKICYQLTLDNYPFQNLGQKLVVTANSNSLANKLLKDNQRVLQIFLLAKNVSDDDYRITDDRYLLSTYFSSLTRYSIAVNIVYQSLDTLNRCSKYKTRENCMSECRVGLFRQMCNCTPTTWSNWISLDNYEECKLSDYILCANYSGSDDIRCMKEHCGTQADLCERWIYDIQPIIEIMNNTDARLEAFIASFDYPVFKEQYELPFEEFIGALGGAIGFYLGLDFLRIFFLISNAIVFLASLFTFFKRREHVLPTDNE